MSKFKQYRRSQIAELRPVTDEEIELRQFITTRSQNREPISVSSEDLKNGSPKKGDMIARDPKNHNDQWLVSEKYFNDNFEEL